MKQRRNFGKLVAGGVVAVAVGMLVGVGIYFTVSFVEGSLDYVREYTEYPRDSVSLNVGVRYVWQISELTVSGRAAGPVEAGRNHKSFQFDDLPLGQHELTYIFSDELHTVEFEIVEEGGFLTVVNGLVFDDPKGTTRILNTEGLVFDRRAESDDQFLREVGQ